MIRFSFITLLLTAQLCVLCAEETATFTNRELAFSIQYPGDWDKQENVSAAAVTLAAPPKDKEFRRNVNVIVHDLPKGTTLDQFANAQTSGVEKMFAGYVREDKKDVELNKVKALQIVFRFTQKELKLKCQSVLLVSGEHGYIVTCTAEAANFDAAQKSFDDILASFKAL